MTDGKHEEVSHRALYAAQLDFCARINRFWKARGRSADARPQAHYPFEIRSAVQPGWDSGDFDEILLDQERKEK